MDGRGREGVGVERLGEKKGKIDRRRIVTARVNYLSYAICGYYMPCGFFLYEPAISVTTTLAPTVPTTLCCAACCVLRGSVRLAIARVAGSELAVWSVGV